MKDILNQFAILNEVADPQPLKIGFINDSFIVRAKHEGEKSYFLQRINHHIFQNVEEYVDTQDSSAEASE